MGDVFLKNANFSTDVGNDKMSELVWRYALKYLGACVMTVYEMLCPHRGILIDGTLPGEAGEFL